MWMYEEMIGKQYGNWTVLEYSHSVDNSKFRKDRNAFVKDKRHFMLAQCTCGTIRKVRKDGLTSGSTKSCGCLNKRSTTHGKSNTRIYRSYKSMKERCYNDRSEIYKYYGERGIRICDEWLNDFQTFYNWSISNGYTDELTIDRIDNDGNYEPSNCRWVDMKAQSRNKRNNVYVTYNNQTKILADWAKEKGMSRGILSARLIKGWTFEEAINTPVGDK